MRMCHQGSLSPWQQLLMDRTFLLDRQYRPALFQQSTFLKKGKKDRWFEGRFMKETFTVGWVKILHQLTPMYFAYGHLITSRTPYWCPKTWNSGYVGVSNQSCGGWSREWVINICIFVAINTVYPKSFDDMFSVICYVFVRSLLHICQDPPGVCFVTQRRMVTRKPTLEES